MIIFTWVQGRHHLELWIQLEINKSLGQFFVEYVPWSPTIQVHCDCIDYWHCVLCIKIRVLTSKNAIKKLSIELREYSSHCLSALACLDKLKIAWKEYRVAKKEVGSLWKAFVEDKIARKVHNRKVTTDNMVKMLKKEQRSIQEGVESKQIRERNNKQPVLEAEITDFITSITTTVYIQEKIVIAAAESNLWRQSQTVGTAFHQSALFDTFGPCADIEANCLGILDGTFVLHEDADPYAVTLLKTMVEPQSLRDKSPINCIPWRECRGLAPSKRHHRCVVRSSNQRSSQVLCLCLTLNDIDCMMQSALLEFDLTPKEWCVPLITLKFWRRWVNKHWRDAPDSTYAPWIPNQQQEYR